MEAFFKKYQRIFFVVVAIGMLVGLPLREKREPETRPLNELATIVPTEVRRVEIELVDQHIRRYTLQYRDGSTRVYTAPVEMVSPFLERARQAGIPLVVEQESIWAKAGKLLRDLFLPIALLLFFGRDVWGKRFRPLPDAERPKITFAHVGGYETVKGELQVLVAQLRNPGRVLALGGRPPRGILLSGPPGTGKTLLARALAGEAGVPFFSVSGSQFGQMWLGLGAKHVRDLFEAAKRAAPCIIFIDEVDAVGGHRSSEGPEDARGHSEDRRTLNELLTQMDGFSGRADVIVVAATNDPDALDKALLRPGRFDRKIEMVLPDRATRLAILQANVANQRVPLERDVDLSDLARRTPGFSGADLENLLNEAVLFAANAGDERVSQAQFLQALDRLTMGLRSSRAMSKEERHGVAVHEAGHAIVARYVPDARPIDKLTIVSHGNALGMLVHDVGDQSWSRTRKALIAELAVLLGGRLAEEHFLGFNAVSNGAADDLTRVADLAYDMAFSWGFTSDEAELVPIPRALLANEIMDDATVSGFCGQRDALIKEAKALAQTAIQDHAEEHKRLAEALLDRETLTGPEIERLLAGTTPK